MSHYILKYLPVDKPLTDGCTVINSAGAHVVYNESNGWTDNAKASVKVAGLFFVTYEFNEMKVVGQPGPGCLKWLKPGDLAKIVDCEEWIHISVGDAPFVSYCSLAEYPDRTPLDGVKIAELFCVKCPTCQTLH